MDRLHDEVAVITGASSGIGECIARAFAREGAKVVVCARSTEKVRAVAGEINSTGGRALAVSCDVTLDDSVAELREQVDAEFGAPSILVNSAGIYKIAGFQQATLDDYRDALEVNYLGCVRMIKTFAPAMVDKGYGRIVNIASTAGKYGSMFQAHYNGSKHAVVGITRSLALEFAKTGVRINAICPGFVNTPMLGPATEDYAKVLGTSSDEALQTWLSRVPIGRFLETDEIIPLAVYLASRESDGMTGQAITIAGGMILV